MPPLPPLPPEPPSPEDDEDDDDDDTDDDDDADDDVEESDVVPVSSQAATKYGIENKPRRRIGFRIMPWYRGRAHNGKGSMAMSKKGPW